MSRFRAIWTSVWCATAAAIGGALVGCGPVVSPAPNARPHSQGVDRDTVIVPAVPELEVVSSNAPPASTEPVTADASLMVSSGGVIVVCPEYLRPSLSRWIERRKAEGLRVTVVPSYPTCEELSTKIRSLDDLESHQYVLLVGGTDASAGDGPVDPSRFVPTFFEPADVTAAWQPTSTIPGDFQYGDFRGNRLPHAAVGRLPVKTPAELTRMVDRIIEFEESRDFSRWRSRVDLIAGLGGFGAMVDGAIEAVARGLITQSLPAWVRTRITHAGPSSPFYPGPGAFTPTVLRNYAEGAGFWVYAGHGWVTELDRVPLDPRSPNSDSLPVLDVSTSRELRRGHGAPPIGVLLACYTGAFDAQDGCLAEHLLLAEQGPVAILAGSRVTMPYANVATALGLIEAVYHDRCDRIGDAWVLALQELAAASDSDPSLHARRMMIDSLATVLGDTRIDDQRREHMQLYNWFGDPTLRLRYPEPLRIDPPGRCRAATLVRLSGSSPIAGRGTIELHRSLGSFISGSDLKDDLYSAANDTVLASADLEVLEPGTWEVSLEIPAGIQGPMTIRVDLQSADRFASGAEPIWVQPSP